MMHLSPSLVLANGDDKTSIFSWSTIFFVSYGASLHHGVVFCLFWTGSKDLHVDMLEMIFGAPPGVSHMWMNILSLCIDERRRESENICCQRK